ncbi:TetR/AcrR family transcriptional regulator [Amycolatopsis vastitatis]|uniref:TetR family transcriptional regulator n=1 Tax=Amycolatopsis vastitatis TaxID=1905142 RepID=A0A229T4E7_9PSEU|nr:TetR/AcrR family transcriptional regulator [Amycolatopsis vastitatis]OXM65953.1 TetR family transcriptional regulator [Amycolatopsis vastitatis]
MPKRVDHQQRRREIAEALFRIAARRGLQGVTLRAVAAEAGISMNLVQYYFPAKDDMLRFGWQRIVELSAERAAGGIARALETGDERAVVRAYLAGVLPSDERGRMLCAVQIAYFAVDVTRGEQNQEQEPLLPHLVRGVAEQIRAAQARRRASPDLDAQCEADALATMAAGLVSGVMIGAYTQAQAERLVDYRLDRLFPS